MGPCGPCPLPPAPVQCSAHESERRISSNGNILDTSTFANLLCDLFSEHQRCVREAAGDGQRACEPEDLKMSAYISSSGSLHREALRMSACELAAEKQKHMDTLQARIQSVECPRQEIWHISHPTEVGLKPVCFEAPAEPEQDHGFSHFADMCSQQAPSTVLGQDQEASHAPKRVSLHSVETQDITAGHYESMDNASEQSLLEMPSRDSQPTRRTSLSSRCSSLSRASTATIRDKDLCAVNFFEQHKESFKECTTLKGGRKSMSTTISMSNFEFLPESMSRVLESTWFELFSGGLILANAFVMAVELQYSSKYPTSSNQMQTDLSQGGDRKSVV